jgi:two-component system, LytTR family, response regulator
MKVVIIEDEELAVEGLIQGLRRIVPHCEILAALDSVKEAVKWFGQHEAPDLAFFDIQLADGLSFAIFEQCEVTCPLIFTTAYDAYALRAFKVNSIDYLLKPYELEDLQKALQKWRNLRAASTIAPDVDLMRQLMQQMSAQIRQPQFKTRFMVKIGDHLQSVAKEDIAYFYSENKITWLKNQQGRKYLVDYTLDQLEDLLDPTQFFRANRQFIITLDSIKSVAAYTNSRMKLLLKDPPSQDDIIISREKVEALKEWMGR